MMHNRKRRTTPITEEELAKQLQQKEAIQRLHDRVLAAMNSLETSPEAFDLTAKCMAISPDFYTNLNYRRKILIAMFETEPDNKLKVISKELELLMRCMKESPKSYTLWFHRQWCLIQIREMKQILRKELELCDYMLKKDERNFHCWNYRTWVVKLIDEISDDEELHFTNTMILRDFSNYSAWHYRTKIVQKMHSNGVPHDFVRAELDQLKNGYFTCPNDQSVWAYHKWLIEQVLPIRIASISPVVISEPVESILVGFSHKVTGLSSESIAISLGWEAVEGEWEPLRSAPYSYIWRFKPNRKLHGEIEIRLNAYNETLKEINGGHALSNSRYKYNKKGDSFVLSSQCDDDIELLQAEIRNIDELLEYEDEARSQPVLRKAQLYEEVLMSSLHPPSSSISSSIIQCYEELIQIDSKHRAFYSENLKTYKTLFSPSSSSTSENSIVSHKLQAKILPYINLTFN
jgi:hypothetical protein